MDVRKQKETNITAEIRKGYTRLKSEGELLGI